MGPGRWRGGAACVAALLGVAACKAAHGTGGTGGAGGMGGAGGAGGAEVASPPAWQVVYDGTALGGAVLSAWGTGPDDVYVVGGPLGNTGFEAVAVHYDGAAWTRLAPGGAASFWWVYGSGAKDVWMVGEAGRITHWDGAAFTEIPPLTTATIWGVWAASPTDAWAVGGTPEGGTAQPNDIVLHWDGAKWAQETLPGAPLGRSLYKVWGTASTDLYVVGESGTVWHRRGTTWALEANPATGTLFTAFGCDAADVYAVGGQDVLHSGGDGAWAEVPITLGNTVNGVTCNPAPDGGAGEVLVVGFGGLKQRLVGGVWINDFSIMPWSDLHGSWADDHGAFWAAGGDFDSPATPGKPREAVIARYGAGKVPPLTP